MIGIVQFIERSGSSKNNHIDVHEVRYIELLRKIVGASAIIIHLLNHQNKNPHACTAKWLKAFQLHQAMNTRTTNSQIALLKTTLQINLIKATHCLSILQSYYDA